MKGLFAQLVYFTISPCLKPCELITYTFLFIVALKGKSYCIMIRGKFRTLSNISHGAKGHFCHCRYWRNFNPAWQGSKYNSEVESISIKTKIILGEHFQWNKILFTVLAKKTQSTSVLHNASNNKMNYGLNENIFSCLKNQLEKTTVVKWNEGKTKARPYQCTPLFQCYLVLMSINSASVS